MSAVTLRLTDSFDDPEASPERWSALLNKADMATVILTWQYQHNWWQKIQEFEELVVDLVSRNGRPQAIAP